MSINTSSAYSLSIESKPSIALFIHDKARATKVVKDVAKEEKAKEKKESGKQKASGKGRKPRDDDPPGDTAEMRQDLPPGQATLF